MNDNFDELTRRYNSSISIPIQEAPGRRPAMGSLENSVPAFDGNSTLWSQMGGVIDTVKKENALLKQEVKELKEHVEKRTKKKTCSPCEKLLLTADDLGYVWTTEVIEEKLRIVYKNEKYKDSLSLEQKYHVRKNIYQENCEALLAKFKDADCLIDRELMSDEEDLHDQYGVVEKKAVLCPSWRSEKGKIFYKKLDELLHRSKKRIASIKRVRGDEYIAEKELSKNQRTRLPSWAIVPLVERAVLSVQPDNSEQHISPLQPEAPSE
ncbi:hypothetical protein INT45_013622 [Circinella minor]|uniref:Uncharacterized protein n=1 Tax=Circinella minor TaxID=1195481 RepID=A0A8H7RUH8_9FUNG|nr:hypothetical protein INT45_013622 [Circinella minor]